MIMQFKAVHFAIPTNLFVKTTMFRHRDTHKHASKTPEGKTNNQTDHVLIDRRWHSRIFHVSKRQEVCKRATRKMDIEISDVQKLNEREDKKNYQVTITSLQLWKI
jgi:hypothetical protein